MLLSIGDRPTLKATKTLKTAAALGVEAPSGQRRIIKPSMKARATAGIASDEDRPKPEVGRVQAGQKRKKPGNTKVHISMAPKVISTNVHISVTPKALRRNCTRKTGVPAVDSGESEDDLESSEEVESQETCNPEKGDEVDAYERLRVQRETDRPVSSDS